MSRGVLIDSNVLIDLTTPDSPFHDWSSQQIRHCLRNGTARINPIIYAELAAAFATPSDLDAFLPPDAFERRPLPFAAGFAAGQAFVTYRRRGGTKTAPLPDFYIGAHALTEDFTLLTRDEARF